jgi:hypothetical protein
LGPNTRTGSISKVFFKYPIPVPALVWKDKRKRKRKRKQYQDQAGTCSKVQYTRPIALVNFRPGVMVSGLVWKFSLYLITVYKYQRGIVGMVGMEEVNCRYVMATISFVPFNPVV